MPSKRYIERKSRGLCVCCGKKAIPNRIRCKDCREIEKIRRQLSKQNIRGCFECGEIGHNQRTCPRIIGDYMASLSRDHRYRLRKKINNICRDCPNPRDKVDSNLCGVCRRKYAYKRRIKNSGGVQHTTVGE